MLKSCLLIHSIFDPSCPLFSMVMIGIFVHIFENVRPECFDHTVNIGMISIANFIAIHTQAIVQCGRNDNITTLFFRGGSRWKIFFLLKKDVSIDIR